MSIFYYNSQSSPNYTQYMKKFVVLFIKFIQSRHPDHYYESIDTSFSKINSLVVQTLLCLSGFDKEVWSYLYAVAECLQ